MSYYRACFLIAVAALTAACARVTQLTPTPWPTRPPDSTPEPSAAPSLSPTVVAPAIVDRQPKYRQLEERRPTISLTFDRAMNWESVEAALSVEPAVPFVMDWKDKTLQLIPEQPLTPGAQYTFTLARTAMDVNGISLFQDYRWSYELPGVLSTYHPPAKLNTPLTIRFNYPLDTASVRRSLSLEPALNGTWSWDDKRKLAAFTPSVPFTGSLTYTVHFAGRLLDANGDELPLPGPFSFTTPSPILNFSPPAHSGISPAAVIQITFDRPMDRAATEAAFTISPDLPGRFEWDETTLTFKPERVYLNETTSYTVTIGVEARAGDGTALFMAPYRWSFRTGPMENIASFGDGPNAQVVDADGRRTIQFVLVRQDNAFVTFDLYRLNLEQFLDRYSSGFRGVVGYEKKSISTEGALLVKSWPVDDSAQAIHNNHGGFIKETTIPADVPPGVYILNLTAGHVNDQLILLLTRRVIAVKQAEGQLVAWVTDINGGPVPGVEVGVYARNGQLISQGQANELGVYRTVVARDPQPLIVIAREGDDLTAAGFSHEWQGYSGWWGWGWWQPTPTAQNYAMYIYTDRPIYRPGQTVYFKAIVRRDEDAVLHVLPGAAVTARIRDARNNVVQTIPLTTNQFGSVNGEFQLAEGAMLGNYTVEISVEGESHKQVFKVQDYRKPDYEVTVATDAGSYVVGDTIRVTVDSRYFFGEPVPNATVSVRRYTLGQSYCWENCEGGYVWYDSHLPAILGKTDSQGRFTATLHAEQGNYAQNLYWWSTLQQSTWGIEATVEDGSRQLVSSFSVVNVFSAAEKIWLETNGYLKTPGQPFDVQASAVTIFDQPVAGRELRLQLRRWSPSTGDYTTVVQSHILATEASGKASLPLTVAEPGYYQLRLAGRDGRGNELSYDSWLYVFSNAGLWEPRANNDLSIAADQDTYAPGETATLIIESTFSGPALLTFERGTTRREQLISLTAPLTRLGIPIQPDDAPNIFVTVNAWQEQDTRLVEHPEDYYTYPSLSDSQLRTASVNLHVPVTDKTLHVTITPHKETYAPREQATFTVRVTNGRGEPVSAEVSLALVDEAIFSLSDELSGPIFDAFYFERGNLVRTYNSMALQRTLWICECGGGGGGGGGDALGNPRSNFPDTAAWLPVLHTDWKGEAIVTFTLPDSLTRWRLTAKAATADTQVGETFTHIVTKQEIVVRPLLPRTLTAGDRVELSAFVHNYSEEPREIAVSVESDLLRIDSAVTQTLSLGPGERRIVGWPALALGAGEAAVTVKAANADEGDAVRLTLPIQPLAIPDVTTQIGDFSGELNTTIVIPGEALNISTVKIELSRSIAGSLLTGLEYLTGFPYGCVEQTMSKALPNAVVGRAFHQLGMGHPTLHADLPPKINASVQRLYGFQHNDGGWGWWFDDNTDAYQTAWVVFGLSVTAEAGYEVDSGVVKRGVDWLAANLEDMDLRTRAFALYSMSVAGYGDLAAARELLKSSAELDAFSQAALALSLQKLGATADARQMLNALSRTAVVKDGKVYWPNAAEDGYYHDKTMSSTLRSTALALEAFVQINPNHELEPGIVRYLMSQRRESGWGSTNETSFAILALTDHLLAKEIATTNTDYSVELNGQIIASGALGKGEPAVSLELPASQLARGENSLRIQQSGGGRLYYVISRRVYLPQSAIEAAGNVLVSRAYLDPKTNKPITNTIEAGQLVKVRLTVTMPDNGFYILVEDKLPGGLEALNEGLNITSHESSAYDYCGSYECYGERYQWQEYGYNNKEVRGDRVSFFITEVGQGQHIYTYFARAIRTGEFVALPAQAWAMYDMTVWGRSASSMLEVIK